MRPGCAACPATARCVRRQRALLAARTAATLLVLAGTILLSGRLTSVQATEPEVRNRDIILCLDGSGSMDLYNAEVVRQFQEIVSGLARRAGRDDDLQRRLDHGVPAHRRLRVPHRRARPGGDRVPGERLRLRRRHPARRQPGLADGRRPGLLRAGLRPPRRGARPRHRAGLGQRPAGAADLHARGRGPVRRRPRRRRLRHRLARDARPTARSRSSAAPSRRPAGSTPRSRRAAPTRSSPASSASSAPGSPSRRSRCWSTSRPSAARSPRPGSRCWCSPGCAGRSGGGDDPPSPRPCLAGRAGRRGAARGRRLARRTACRRAPLVAAARADGAAGDRDRAAPGGGGAARRGAHLRPRGAGRRRPHAEHVGARLGRRAAPAGRGPQRPARAHRGAARRPVLAGHRRDGWSARSCRSPATPRRSSPPSTPCGARGCSPAPAPASTGRSTR